MTSGKSHVKARRCSPAECAFETTVQGYEKVKAMDDLLRVKED